MSATKPKLTFDDLYTKQTEALYNLVMSSDQKWRQKWADDGFSQRNADTDKGYSNMNQTLLFNRAVQENLDDPRWLTFAQAKEHGYQIRKGAKSSEIFRLLDQTYKRKVKDENGNVLKDENGKDITETLKYNQRLIVKHNVFNARDIDGIEPFKRAEIPEEHKQLLKQENYKNAELMISAFCQENGISLQEMASEKAFYTNNEFFHRGNNGVTEHKVVLPLKAQFDNLDDYFSVAFHEVAHSTKVLDIRINKATDTPTGNEFGSKNYAKEELTAELTALFLCRQFGINSTDIAERENNSLAYLKTWINQGVLDKDDFFVAVKEANRATRAIAEYAPKITLSLDNLTQKQTEIIAQAQEEPQKKDTFAQQIESIFTKGSIETATLLRVANDNKTFTNSNGLLNLDLTNKKNPYQEYVDNGYLKLVKESGINGFVKTYELTEKGKNTVNEVFDKVIAQENEKQGAKVTKKEVETLIDKLYSSHRNHAGGTEDEFRQSSFPESIIPKLDEAEKLLERPFNKHSLPYKEQLNNVLKLSNEYLEKWDNLQKGCFAFETGEVISQVKVLWTEANGEIEDKKLGQNLNDVQNFIKNTYLNAEWRDDKNYNPLHPEKEYGYDKWQLELTYQTKNEQGETIYEKEKVRIDVGKGNGDFNPLTMEFKDYLSQLTKTPIIEQTPKLSAEIRQELKQQQAEALQVKQQSKGMSIH